MIKACAFSSPDTERIVLFQGLKQHSLSIDEVSNIIGVSSRTLRDWRRGKFTMPLQLFNEIAELAAIEPQSLKAEELNEWWNNSEAGKMGAEIRMEKLGPLGTPEGRRLGGINSYKRRKKDNYGIFNPKPVVYQRTTNF